LKIDKGGIYAAYLFLRKNRKMKNQEKAVQGKEEFLDYIHREARLTKSECLEDIERVIADTEHQIQFLHRLCAERGASESDIDFLTEFRQEIREFFLNKI